MLLSVELLERFRDKKKSRKSYETRWRVLVKVLLKYDLSQTQKMCPTSKEYDAIILISSY